MLFTSSILRLDALLCANAIALPANVRDALDVTLKHQLANGDVAAIKGAAHQVKATVASTGTSIKQSLAFEALAAYLGARDWNTLRAHVEKSGLSLATGLPEGIVHFQRNAEQFARFVFELQSKRGCIGDFATLFRKRPTLKVRLLSRYSPDVHPAVEAWLYQANNPAFPTISELMHHRADFLRTVSTYDASFNDRTSRAARHFIVIEARVTEALATASNESEVQSALSRERQQVRLDLQTALQATIYVSNTEVIAGFENCDTAPFGDLEPWHYSNFTRVSGARSQFDAVIDLEHATEKTAEAGFTLVRHGIVSPPKPPVGRFQKIRQVLGLSPSSPCSPDPGYVIQTSPWASAIAAAGNTGMLLQQREHGLARIAPWGITQAEHFLVLSTSGGGKTFMGREILTQALAHGKRLRVLGIGREYVTLFRDFLGGAIFAPDTAHPVSLNPFSGIASTGALQRLQPALAVLLHELLGLQDDAAVPLLERAISSAWAVEKDALELAHIGAALGQLGTPEANALSALATQLAELAGPWLAGRASVPFHENALLLELDGLRNAPGPLLTLLERTVLGLLHLEALGNPRSSVHLYEELYGFTPSARYVKRMTQDCAEAGTSIGFTSQSLNSVLREEFGKGFFQPEMTILQLYLYSGDREIYREHLGMSESEADTLRALRPAGRNTQVALVKNRRIEGVFEFALEPFTRLTYATTHREWSKILDRVRTGESYMDAVRALAAQEQAREGL
jgi:hypothetical protein